MSNKGYLFEMGPDGYGYIIDQADSRNSYPIHVNKIIGAPAPGIELEGRSVTFSIENQRVENVELEARIFAGAAKAKSTTA